jgi:GNAT superfamily N-acetyltransferase
MEQGTVPLNIGGIQQAGSTLARAFMNDPLWIHILPDEPTRRRAMPAFFTTTAAYGVDHGRVDTTPQTDGVAIWIPPAFDGSEVAGTDAAEYGAVEEQFDLAAAARFTAMVEHYHALRRRDMPAPHWYLACLGVHPERQGRGIGHALLKPVLQTADRARLPSYLETENEANLLFYASQGFEVLEQGVLAGGGPRYWTMHRRPPGK